jgi:hypothetical protein
MKQNMVVAIAAARMLANAGVGRHSIGLFPTSWSPMRRCEVGILTTVVSSARGDRRMVCGGERFAPTFIDGTVLLQGSSGGEKQRNRFVVPPSSSP